MFVYIYFVIIFHTLSIYQFYDVYYKESDETPCSS